MNAPRTGIAALTASIVGALYALAAASCGSSTPAAPVACVIAGRSCVADTECCTSYCQLQGDAAYCQARPAVEPECSGAEGFCTQDRHCCSGLCDKGACIGGTIGSTPGTPASQCRSMDAACTGGDQCCSGRCVASVCKATQLFDGGSCLAESLKCSSPSECCSKFCLPSPAGGSVCGGIATTPGGGGNCGASGAFCQRASDCCTQQCVSTASSKMCK